jgi:hypothetical protein
MKKRGPKPFIWHSEPGRAFLYAVFAVQQERHPIKISDAINIVVKRPEFAHLNKRYKPRKLQKKYQEILKASPYSRLYHQIRMAAYRSAPRIRGTESELGEHYLSPQLFH